MQAGGAVVASAGNSINITAGQSSQSVDEAHQHTSKGFLSKKTVTTRETLERTDSLGSAFSGNTVTLLAGQDIKIQGSSAVSDQGTTLVAGNNITIEAAQNTRASSSFRDEKKSGIFSGGGLHRPSARLRCRHRLCKRPYLASQILCEFDQCTDAVRKSAKNTK